jgi:RNA polymerase sigma-70 factor (ECF subfamily)
MSSLHHPGLATTGHGAGQVCLAPPELAGSALVADHAAGGDLERRALAGEAEAWERLVSRHQQRVLVSVLALGLPPAQAREIVQETWLALVQKQRAGKLDRLDLPGLAIAQARFLALDALRAMGRGAGREIAETQPVWPGPNPESQALQRAQVARILRLLERCPRHKRQMFLMYYGQQRTAQSIAEELGVTTQHVRQSLYETRMELRAALEGE